MKKVEYKRCVWKRYPLIFQMVGSGVGREEKERFQFPLKKKRTKGKSRTLMSHFEINSLCSVCSHWTKKKNAMSMEWIMNNNNNDNNEDDCTQNTKIYICLRWNVKEWFLRPTQNKTVTWETNGKRSFGNRVPQLSMNSVILLKKTETKKID